MRADPGGDVLAARLGLVGDVRHADRHETVASLGDQVRVAGAGQHLGVVPVADVQHDADRSGGPGIGVVVPAQRHAATAVQVQGGRCDRLEQQVPAIDATERVALVVGDPDHQVHLGGAVGSVDRSTGVRGLLQSVSGTGQQTGLRALRVGDLAGEFGDGGHQAAHRAARSSNAADWPCWAALCARSA